MDHRVNIGMLMRNRHLRRLRATGADQRGLTKSGFPLFYSIAGKGSLLGNLQAAGVRSSRKLNLYHYSFSETLHVGVVLYGVDRGCMQILPLYGVLGRSPRCRLNHASTWSALGEVMIS